MEGYFRRKCHKCAALITCMHTVNIFDGLHSFGWPFGVANHGPSVVVSTITGPTAAGPHCGSPPRLLVGADSRVRRSQGNGHREKHWYGHKVLLARSCRHLSRRCNRCNNSELLIQCPHASAGLDGLLKITRTTAGESCQETVDVDVSNRSTWSRNHIGVINVDHEEFLHDVLSKKDVSTRDCHGCSVGPAAGRHVTVSSSPDNVGIPDSRLRRARSRYRNMGKITVKYGRKAVAVEQFRKRTINGIERIPNGEWATAHANNQSESKTVSASAVFNSKQRYPAKKSSANYKKHSRSSGNGLVNTLGKIVSAFNIFGWGSSHHGNKGVGSKANATVGYQILRGDTLGEIAQAHNVSVTQIRRLNKSLQRSDFLEEGSVLQLPMSRSGRRALAAAHQAARFKLGRSASLQERTAAAVAMVGRGPNALNYTDVPGVARGPGGLGQRRMKGGPKSKWTSVRVRPGDHLWDVSARAGVTMRHLQRINHLTSDNLTAGQLLRVAAPASQSSFSTRQGFRRTARPLFSRAQPLALLNARLPTPGSGAGIGMATSWGGSGGAMRLPAVSRELRIAFVRWQMQHKPSHWRRRGKHFISPVADGFISSSFGPRWGALHEGVDLAAEQGTPVRAAGDGIVVYAGLNGGYGKLLSLAHGDGFTTRYAHCARIHVKSGQVVKRGQVVAAVGSTGHSTGPHLHFELRHNRVPQDPAAHINL
eukprot:jgi/Mesvir1/24515/Mv21858-RA.1